MITTFQSEERKLPSFNAMLTYRDFDNNGNAYTAGARVGDVMTGYQHPDVTIPTVQVLALNATARQVIPALGAGLVIVPKLWAVHKPAGTAYGGIAAGEDLVLRYTDASGSQCASAIETTGFLDQTTAQTRLGGPVGASGATAVDFRPTADAAVMIHLLVGEIITGNSDLIVRVWYDVVNASF